MQLHANFLRRDEKIIIENRIAKQEFEIETFAVHFIETTCRLIYPFSQNNIADMINLASTCSELECAVIFSASLHRDRSAPCKFWRVFSKGISSIMDRNVSISVST
jgi:hypothetical protein